jgi:nucleoside 2-deoxyribosyltransferase
MKIYFAGSIRGGRDDTNIYFGIIKKLSAYGKVLTEHVGDLDLSDAGETKLTEKEICKRDLDWIQAADVVVAEITQTSIGVGYEIGFAEAHKKKVLVLYRPQPDKKPSAMIRGNTYVVFREYTNLDELDSILKEFLS